MLSLHNDKVRNTAAAVVGKVDMESRAAGQALVLLHDVHTYVVEYLSHAVVSCKCKTVCVLLKTVSSHLSPASSSKRQGFPGPTRDPVHRSPHPEPLAHYGTSLLNNEGLLCY